MPQVPLITMMTRVPFQNVHEGQQLKYSTQATQQLKYALWHHQENFGVNLESADYKSKIIVVKDLSNIDN